MTRAIDFKALERRWGDPGSWVVERVSLYFDLTDQGVGGLARSWLPGVGHIRS